MTERTLPTLFVNEVLGAHADDPGFAKIGVRAADPTAGSIEVQLMVPVAQLDALISALITAKGYFDWPAPNADLHHGISETEVNAGQGRVALRLFGRIADQSPGPPPPPGHLTFITDADTAESIGRNLIDGAQAARRS